MKGSKLSFLAVYPSVEKDQNVLNRILKNAHNAKITASQPTTFKSISIFPVKEKNLLPKMVTASFPKGGHPILCCPIDDKINPDFINKLEEILPTRIDGEFVDLSELKFDGKPIQPPFYLSGKFILFYSAVYCAENGFLGNIHKISLESNGIRETSWDIWSSIRYFFPNVKLISLARNLVKNARPIEGMTIVLNPDDERFTGISKEDPFAIIPQIPTSYIWNEKGPLTAQQPLTVVCGTPFAEEPKLEVDDVQQVEFDPEEDVIQDFLYRWINAHKKSVPGLFNFYAPTAVFTLSVDESPSDSPLQMFAQYSRNMIKDYSPSNIAQGPEEISEALTTLFGDTLEIAVSDYTFETLFNGLYALTLTGCFSLCGASDVFQFVRTVALGYDGKVILLTNDQLHIRLPK